MTPALAFVISAACSGRSEPTDRAHREPASRRSGTGAISGARFSGIAIVMASVSETSAFVANQSWRWRAPGRPKRSCRRSSAAIPTLGVGRRRAIDVAAPKCRHRARQVAHHPDRESDRRRSAQGGEGVRFGGMFGPSSKQGASRTTLPLVTCAARHRLPALLAAARDLFGLLERGIRRHAHLLRGSKPLVASGPTRSELR